MVCDVSNDSISGEMLRMLTDVGFVATGKGMREDAGIIFDAIISARPKNEYVNIACAFMHIVFGEYSDASKLLVEGALKINPCSEIAKSFYGLLLYQVGQRGQGISILEDIKNNGKDIDAINLAKKIIEEG